jgi:beta-glucanase (GH16 family)
MNGITWYIDDQSFHAIDTKDSQFDEFREKYFFIFNVAVGGKWPGSPNTNTTFPQYLHVDYVRVFQK